jgi:hypothetical protein
MNSVASVLNVEIFRHYHLCADNASKHNDASLKHDNIMGEEAG